MLAEHAAGSSQYARLPADSVPEALRKPLRFDPTVKQDDAALERFLVDLFSRSANNFRHDRALADKVQDKVLLLRKPAAARSISAAVAVRESRSRCRCASLAECSFASTRQDSLPHLLVTFMLGMVALRTLGHRVRVAKHSLKVLPE